MTKACVGRRYTANAVCARRQGLASCDELERNVHDNSTGVLGVGTYAQPKQASQSKYKLSNIDFFMISPC